MKTKKDKQVCYRSIQSLASKYSISLLCRVIGISRSGYYKWVQRQCTETEKQREDKQLKQLMMKCVKEVKGIYGYPRIKAWLFRKHGLIVNHKRVYRLMKEMGIQAKIRRKRKYFGKKSEKVVSDNLLNRDFSASHPNKKWVTDITYIDFGKQRMYLSVIYDLFNNEVVAYKLDDQNNLKLVLNKVKEAIKKRDARGTLLHSDRGFQYTSPKYSDLLKKCQIRPSMSRKGNCLDNACIENFFGHLKSELLYLQLFNSKEMIRRAIKNYIHFYNTERIQLKLHSRSPMEYRRMAAS